MKRPVSFIYHCRKPNSVIDIWTKEPLIAEELSNQGCTVSARGFGGILCIKT